MDHPLRKTEGVRDPSIFTAGLTTSITGLHCDVAVMDDVVVYENAYTQEGRNKVKSQYSLLSSIEGATALKLDESYEINDEPNAAINLENTQQKQQFENTSADEETINDMSSGVSMESAAYMENNINNVQESPDNSLTSSDEIIEEYTPKLFSEEQSFEEETEAENNELVGSDSEQLFDQDSNSEEDFEIPAFLRKQKF